MRTQKKKLFLKGLMMILDITLWSCSSSGKLTSQNSKKAGKEQKSHTFVVGKVNDKPVSFRELMIRYNRDGKIDTVNTRPSYEKLARFLNLYLTYRSKLAAAKHAGYFQNPDILSEFRKYEKQYGFQYWFNHRLKNHLLNQLIQRSDSAVHLAHILIRLSPHASPVDTIKTYNRLMKARQEFNEGVPFQELIKEYSTTIKKHPLGGDLGFISAGMVVKPFEDAAYNTPVDNVSMPIRTKYGYHLVYVKGKRKKVPAREVSFIFFQTKGKGLSIKSAMKKANKVYQKLQNGVPWDSLVIKYSEDYRSKLSNGNIGWVHPGQYLPGFTDTVFAISHPHTYTKPFYSGYGVHIVRLDSIRTYRSPQQKNEELKKMLKNLPRYKEHDELIIRKIEKIGHTRVIDNNYWALKKALIQTDTLNLSTIQFQSALLKKTLFQINGIKYKVKDFVKWLQHTVNNPEKFTYRYIYFQKFKKHEAENQLILMSLKMFPEFATNTHTYLNGLVVYKISQDSVWNYAQKDTSALRKLYRAKPQDYYYNTRYRYYGMVSNKISTLKSAVNLIRSGISVDRLKNDIHGYLRINKDVVDNLSTEPYSKLKGLQNGEFSKPFTYHNSHMILYLNKILEPREMTFKEAYSKLVSDYQPIRKKEWEKSLESRYHVKAYPKQLKLALEQSKK
ncbi:MAG TPA: peptidylprolyl isomerase [Balneolales bacterium]|nr:peptidylprolyl isomerase [Balneolales bacterium]